MLCNDRGLGLGRDPGSCLGLARLLACVHQADPIEPSLLSPMSVSRLGRKARDMRLCFALFCACAASLHR
jgi:hypothetical protein